MKGRKLTKKKLDTRAITKAAAGDTVYPYLNINVSNQIFVLMELAGSCVLVIYSIQISFTSLSAGEKVSQPHNFTKDKSTPYTATVRPHNYNISYK